MGACALSPCCKGDSNNIDTKNQIVNQDKLPLNQANLFESVIKDEKQLQKLDLLLMKEDMNIAELGREISGQNPKATLALLAKEVKTNEEYQTLCLKDSKLAFKSIEFGSVKYLGQVRMMTQQNTAADGFPNEQLRSDQQGASPGENQDFDAAMCGYGKMIWPDNSTFEGYWLNGQACGVGVFTAPAPSFETYQGFWQHDRMTNMCVFRQNHQQDAQKAQQPQDDELQFNWSQPPEQLQNGKGIEVWSDGSYYHGEFIGGVKAGAGCYYWADGSRYVGQWANDEMCGNGSFQWADGRYFEGSFQGGVMHGFGKYAWLDGRRYEGHYCYNKKHGEGTYTYSDGSKYRGEWKDGMQHGKGYIIDAEQTYERKGVWAKGKLKQWLQDEYEK